MKKSLKIILLVLLIMIAGFVAFLKFYPLQAVNLVFPKLENIKRADISLSGDSAFINAELQFENKSFLKLNIDSFIYRIRLDTLTMLSKAQDLDLRLRPHQTDTVHLPIALPFKRVMEELKRVHKQDSMDLAFDLKLVYSTWFGKLSLPFKKTLHVEVPVLPELKLTRLEYVKKHGKTIDLNVHLEIINKGKIELQIYDLSYKLIVKDNLTVKGKDPQELHLKPFSDTSLVIPVKISLEHPIKTLISIATDNDKVNYHLELEVKAQMDKLGREKIPLQIETDGNLELKK